MKKSQLIMVWLLPLIVIGGLFFPLLGYLVVAMMAFLVVMAFFRGRYWCWNLCPRGAFLDIVISKASLKRPVPGVFAKEWFRWLVFALFMAFLTWRILSAGGNIIAVGAVFVSMCLITTVISMVLGVATRHRSWCAICPMGTLQGRIAKKGK
ncbi:MAG: 4Fe-4S binding protein [Candidatus Omnitrophica bacterium]|nr:4Fe-4S binding protein [Candidatus Omnitrophota bacterium]